MSRNGIENVESPLESNFNSPNFLNKMCKIFEVKITSINMTKRLRLLSVQRFLKSYIIHNIYLMSANE